MRRAVIAKIVERVRGVGRSPFHDDPDTRRATWLAPRLKIALTYNEMMEGRLRDPVYRALLYAGSPSVGVGTRRRP